MRWDIAQWHVHFLRGCVGVDGEREPFTESEAPLAEKREESMCVGCEPVERGFGNLNPFEMGWLFLSMMQRPDQIRSVRGELNLCGGWGNGEERIKDRREGMNVQGEEER